MPDAARVLNDAADLLECDGWCRYVMDDEVGRHCSLGAIWFVTDDADEALRAELALRKELETSIAWWNDAGERTQDEVVAKLREVALKVAE